MQDLFLFATLPDFAGLPDLDLAGDPDPDLDPPLLDLAAGLLDPLFDPDLDRDLDLKKKNAKQLLKTKTKKIMS